MQRIVIKFKIIKSKKDMTRTAPEGIPVLGKAPFGLWARTMDQEEDPGREGAFVISGRHPKFMGRPEATRQVMAEDPQRLGRIQDPQRTLSI